MLDGRSFTYLSTKVAHRGPGGEVLGLVGVSIDITAQKKQAAEALETAERLRARNEELETLLDVIPAAVFIATDPEAQEMTGNSYCRALLRVPEGASVARSAPPGVRPENFEVVKDGKPVARDELPVRRAAVTGRPVHDVEMDLAFVDGDRRTIFGSAAPLFDRGGSVRGSVGAFVDITERKRAEQHAAAVSGEMAHRLANLLTIVHAMANITFRSRAPDEQKLQDFERRLQGLGRSVRLMTRSDWDRVPLDELARTCLDLFGAGERIAIEGPAVTVAGGLAQCIGMALHELATNALKYGALSVPDGRVDLRWREGPDPGRTVELEWTESGGPPVEVPASTGFGKVVVRDMLTQQFRATVSHDFARTGVRWRAVIPLDTALPGTP